MFFFYENFSLRGGGQIIFIPLFFLQTAVKNEERSRKKFGFDKTPRGGVWGWWVQCFKKLLNKMFFLMMVSLRLAKVFCHYGMFLFLIV